VAFFADVRRPSPSTVTFVAPSHLDRAQLARTIPPKLVLGFAFPRHAAHTPLREACERAGGGAEAPPCRRERRLSCRGAHAAPAAARVADVRIFAAVTASAPVGHEAGALAGTEVPCVFSFRLFVTIARSSPRVRSTRGVTPRRRSASFGRRCAGGGSASNSGARSSSAPSIVDFFAPEPRLAVEVDGAAHVGRERRDRERDAYLARYGVRVLRVKAWHVERELPRCSCASARRSGERERGALRAPPSSPQGYKVPIAIADVNDFVAVADTVAHPMLNRVARAREAVLLVTRGRVDVLAGDRLSLLRAAVDSIRSTKPV
jgi:hypothetical protein